MFLRGVVALLVGLLLSCSSIMSEAAEPRYGGVLRVATSSSPRTLDPTDLAVATREIGIHIFETLVAFDENFRVVPELASSWSISDDGLVYEFKLREGVKFHNGEEMTSSDVKASIERFMRVSGRRHALAAIERMETPDPHTLVIYLSEPDASLLNALASPLGRVAIQPESVVASAPRDQVELIGTGPYRLAEWIPDRHTRLVRFEEYTPMDREPSGFSGRKNAYLDEILFIPVPNASSRALGLEAGDYDFADFVPETFRARLEQLPDIQVVELGPYAIFTVWINHASPRMADLNLRKAIQARIDAEEMMLAATDGVGELNPGIHFRNQAWHSDAGAELYNLNDPELARRFLEASGYAGEPLVILGATDYDYMHRGALNLSAQLEDIGIATEVLLMDFAAMWSYSRENSEGWDLMMMSHSTRFDPADNVDPYFDPGRHVGRYEPDEELKGWIAGARRSPHLEDRMPYYHNIQQRMYDDVLLWYKLYDLYTFQAHHEKVKGYNPWVMIHFFNTWLAE